MASTPRPCSSVTMKPKRGSSASVRNSTSIRIARGPAVPEALRALAGLVLDPAVQDGRRAVAGVAGHRAVRAAVQGHVDLLVAPARPRAGSPMVIRSPRSSSIARSQKRCTAFMSCVTSRIVRPRRAALHQRVVALALEGAVAHGQHLVDQQQVGVHVHHDREGQPHLHARRVVLELELGEALELGVLDDRVVALARLARARGRA